MPHHRETRRLPFWSEDLFDLVADVASYDQFLPWCRGVRVYNRKANGFDADLVIGFKLFKEHFTSRVTLDRPNRIHVDYIRGPLAYLRNEWWFEPAPGNKGTLLHFEVDFAFKNPVFEKLVGALFEEAVTRMVSAFEDRAFEKLKCIS